MSRSVLSVVSGMRRDGLLTLDIWLAVSALVFFISAGKYKGRTLISTRNSCNYYIQKGKG